MLERVYGLEKKQTVLSLRLALRCQSFFCQQNFLPYFSFKRISFVLWVLRGTLTLRMGGCQMTEYQKERISQMRLAGDSYAAIAETLGLSRNTVKSYCQRNVAVEPVPQKPDEQCELCGNAIMQTSGYRIRRFCSDACRMKWWNAHRNLIGGKTKVENTCSACGQSFTDYPNHKRKYCSHTCYIAHRYGAKQHE